MQNAEVRVHLSTSLGALGLENVGASCSCGVPYFFEASSPDENTLVHSVCVYSVCVQQHPPVLQQPSSSSPPSLPPSLPLCSLSSRMPDMQTEAGATILKHSTA